MKRAAAVAGIFYEGSAGDLMHQVDALLHKHAHEEPLSHPRALIVPHAGYVYSGNVAAAAYHHINKASYNTVFLVGAAHKTQCEGATLPAASHFETPLGLVPVNTAVVDALQEASNVFSVSDAPHCYEHSLEVQLPFLQRLLSHFTIVPVLLGGVDDTVVEQVSAAFKPYFNDSNLFVVSTDLSHYPTAKDAEREDAGTVAAICRNDPQALLQHLQRQYERAVPALVTGLCGHSAVMSLLYLTAGKRFVYHPVLYEHSGMKEALIKSRVVGYQAVVVTDKQVLFNLTADQKKHILGMARGAIVNYIEGRKEAFSVLDIEVSGVFVSVYYYEELRGCLGQLECCQSLNRLIPKLAVDAAFYDTRFPAIEDDELDGLRIEISLLTPLKKINDSSAIVMGRHGILVKKGMRQGTFLPQVGARHNWDVEEYLGHCSRDKAGLGWEGWRNAELFTYEALILKEGEEDA
ncbi:MULTISPECIES: AmmeMemoRadiSam system protein B [unclassified Carboxylicivirga]|uniref:AmmeMemoRadiSam system protein B n=1 Tax=Carboxylicivirga TaxID=1628153 RepID=UPI003D34562D